MKLCVNYLMEVKELIEEGKIDFIDYIKLFSISGDLTPFDWCITKKNVMFHGFVGEFSNVANKDFLKGRDIELQRDYFKRGNTPYISIHINRDRNEGENEEECAKTISENIKAIRKKFDMRILLENVPASEKRPYNKFLSNPEFITRVVNENNCEYLFDIGHARVAAEVLEIPFDEYVSRLPMDKLVEMHLAGSMRLKDGRLTANHSMLHEEDYEFIEKAVKKYKNLEVLTLEYGPFVQNDVVGEVPMVSGDKVNEVAKEQVYNQLVRLNEIRNRL